MAFEIVQPDGLSVRDELLYIATAIYQHEPNVRGKDPNDTLHVVSWKSDPRVYGRRLELAIKKLDIIIRPDVVVNEVVMGSHETDIEVTVSRAELPEYYDDYFGQETLTSFREYYIHEHALCLKGLAETLPGAPAGTWVGNASIASYNQ